MNAAETTRICLYDDGGRGGPAAAAVGGHLAVWLPWIPLEFRDDLMIRAVRRMETSARRRAAIADLAQKLSYIRASRADLRIDQAQQPPPNAEVNYERRLLDWSARPAPDIAYDGHELQLLVARILSREESNRTAIHVWLTERSLVTWDGDARRYRPRVSIYGFPSIISSSGMVLAPASEPESDLSRRLGIGRRDRRSVFPEDCLDYDDPRINELVKGYAMQAILLCLIGEPSCQDPHCRLFEPRCQREMFAAQLQGKDYCVRHHQLLETWQLAHR